MHLVCISSLRVFLLQTNSKHSLHTEMETKLQSMCPSVRLSVPLIVQVWRCHISHVASAWLIPFTLFGPDASHPGHLLHCVYYELHTHTRTHVIASRLHRSGVWAPSLPTIIFWSVLSQTGHLKVWSGSQTEAHATRETCLYDARVKKVCVCAGEGKHMRSASRRLAYSAPQSATL